MPSRPEKTVAMYQEEQAESYNQAIRTLKERGEIDSEASEGEKLATLSQQVLSQAHQEDTTTDAPNRRIPWDIVSFTLSIAGTLLITGLALGSVVFVVSQVLL